MGLIVATTVMILVHMLICCYTLACYFQDTPAFTANIQHYYYAATDDNAFDVESTEAAAEETSKALFGLTWLILIVELPFLLGIGQLVVFHVYLIRTGQSTFKYIMDKQEKAKALEDARLKQQMRENGAKHAAMLKL